MLGEAQRLVGTKIYSHLTRNHIRRKSWTIRHKDLEVIYQRKKQDLKP